ncbi:MAG: 2-C-methyl-D-erythritol 4-phosphate cytidylyltransferase [Planctomycetota bacterium]|nr:2-C-methyl-D-erythritol 4-phosphate cytidylyltransferase [Planctomycetota bacterium]
MRGLRWGRGGTCGASTAAEKDGAAVVGLPVQDTVKEVNPDGWVKGTVSREGLWLKQTPQAFRRNLILAAYERAAADGFYATDDATLARGLEILQRLA